MRVLSVTIILIAQGLTSTAFAEIQTFTATHTYVLGDHDSKDDARQRCLLETKRKILEQAGVYIESESEVKNFDLTKDKITSFAATVMQVKDTKETVGFENGHMTLTLKLTATMDSAEAQLKLAARLVDASEQDSVVAQQERLKYLEAQLEAIQRQMQQAPERAPVSVQANFSTADLPTLLAWAAQRNVMAQLELGHRYNVGKGVLQDYTAARHWYELAAAQGQAIAQNNLGVLYANGNGVPQDYVKAQRWYEKAVVQGDVSAQTNLGALYARGDGVPQDYAKAHELWEKAATQGAVPAQRALGELYLEGKGVPKDYAKALDWYEKAASQGDASDQNFLGGLYHLGQRIPQDYKKAREWYEKAAAQGYAAAQFGLGLLYEFGEGVQKDYVKARGWHEKAAAHGHTGAQNHLGGLFERGQGVPKDYAKARAWYEKAAAQGSSDAQIYLGSLYEGGSGVQQDYVRAYMWYNLAATPRTGNDPWKSAIYLREKVSSRMTPAQIVEAQRLAKQCEARQFKGC